MRKMARRSMRSYWVEAWITLCQSLGLAGCAHRWRKCFPRAYQFADRSSLHFSHDVRAMQLDRHFAYTERESDLLVEPPASHFVQDLALSWRQCLHSLDVAFDNHRLR